MTDPRTATLDALRLAEQAMACIMVGVSLRISQEDHQAIRSALAGVSTALHISRAALAAPQPCKLGCKDSCNAKEHGCASECPALPWQPATQPEPVAWVSVGDRMPQVGSIVMAYYKNSHGHDRRIRAKWIPAKTLEASHDCDGEAEYDEATDTYYCPEGWYECMDNWDEFRAIFVHEGDITHWMPMPPTPDGGLKSFTPPATAPQPEPVAVLKSLGPKPWETSPEAHAQARLIAHFEEAIVEARKHKGQKA